MARWPRRYASGRPVRARSRNLRLVPHWEGLTTQQVVKAVQEAGVVGLGGAAFPTHVKLAPPKDHPVHTLIINGAECEPYLTSDHRTMVEYPERVHFGIRVMMRAMGVQKCVIGVELNKPDAIEALRRTVPKDLDVTILPLTVKYPQGAEKMLIHAVTGVEVPSGKLPVTVGVVVQNVGSVSAIAEVFETGLPLIERIVTVSGHGLRRPANLIVPVGTKLRDLLAFCDGVTADAAEVIIGGPMMVDALAIWMPELIKGHDGRRRPREERDARAAVMAVHSLRPLSRGVPGVPESVDTQRLSRPRGNRYDANDRDASRRLRVMHADRARTSAVEDNPAVAAVPGRAGRRSAAAQKAGENACSAECSLSRHRRTSRSRDSVPRIMWNVVGSLVPVIVAAAWFFGVKRPAADRVRQRCGVLTRSARSAAADRSPTDRRRSPDCCSG